MSAPADARDATPAPPAAERDEAAGAERRFSLWQRFLLALTSGLAWLLLRLIGPTLRFSVSAEEEGLELEPQAPTVFCFWHRATLPACWWYRRQGIAVITSRSFDGEAIARLIARFGYLPVRGSSSRGGARALLESHTLMEEGRSIAFTIDGPRGPRYVAKPGPVLLARNSQRPIVCFYIALERAWVLNTWDAFMIPKPFSRALLRLSRRITVPPEADPAAQQRFHNDLQSALDRARLYAEAHVVDPLPRVPVHPNLR